MTAHIPLPTGEIYCTACQANVAPDSRGRCPVDGVLGIYPEGRPRPEIKTDTLALLHEGERRFTHAGTRRQPLNVRQLRGAV